MDSRTRLVKIAASVLLLAGAALAQPELDSSYVTITHGQGRNYIPFAG